MLHPEALLHSPNSALGPLSDFEYSQAIAAQAACTEPTQDPTSNNSGILATGLCCALLEALLSKPHSLGCKNNL
jgi:hypothetical protein